MEAVESMGVMGGLWGGKEDVEIARPHTEQWEGSGWLSRRSGVVFLLTAYGGGCGEVWKERGGSTGC